MASLPRTARTPSLRSTALAGALVCGAVLATGCSASPAPAASASAGSSAPAGSSTPAGPSAPARTAAASGTGTPAGGGSGTGGGSTAAPGPAPTAAAGGPAPCPTRYLHVHTGISQGTAGSVYTVIDFTNISNTTCTLYGFPGVSQAGGMPVTQIGPAAAESTATPRTLVSLAPGETANALLQITDAGNYPAAQCHPVSASYLQIYPPNQTTPMFLGYTSTACSGAQRILTIGAVAPGTGSSS